MNAVSPTPLPAPRLEPAGACPSPSSAWTRRRPSALGAAVRKVDRIASGILVFTQAFGVIVGTVVLASSSLSRWTTSERTAGICRSCGDLAWIGPVAGIGLSAVGGFLALRQAGRWIKPRASAGRAVIGIAVGGVVAETALLVSSFHLAGFPIA
ncbi:hypothetical protein C6V83_04355 [Gordonia iterans]|uniref:Uncharacterized protein n=1 Tax=Gordonia iterans TaxID=1004901 RepID=A0A2S0KD65_9ACTN|nr:hypothetical protein [Gordonia iterans]AVL99627.1 hypothetical protein C6V83_04355 [Gordonia iterans]